MTLEEMKRLKAEKGYTLTQLSEYSQVPLGTLQKIFTGETREEHHGRARFYPETPVPEHPKKRLHQKKQKYCDAGVKEYWILNPQKKLLLTYDFLHDDMPCFHPLAGTAELVLCDGELKIDLDEIAALLHRTHGSGQHAGRETARKLCRMQNL